MRLPSPAVAPFRMMPRPAVAAGGAGGLYSLRFGTALRRPQYAHWFGKPEGTSYRELFDRLAPVVDRVEGALWMRQLVLGPAREFCLHAAQPVALSTDLNALVIPLRQTWPEPPSKGIDATR